MPAEANIFQQYLQPVRSVNDYLGDMDRREANALQLIAQRRQNDMAGLQADQARQTLADTAADRNALQRLAAGWSADTTADQRVAALRASGRPGLMAQADALEKADVDKAKGRAVASKDQAEADTKGFELRKQKSDQAIRDIANFTSPQEALISLEGHFKNGDIDQLKYDALKAQIPTSPADFPSWQVSMLRGIMSAQENLNSRKPHFANTGGAITALDPITGKPVSSVAVTQSPDSIATNATSRANNAATVGATIRGQNLVDVRTREATAATVGKPFEVTGPDGNPVLVQQDKTGHILPVQGYSPKAANAAEVPASFNKAYVENRQSSADLDRALDLVSKNPDAFGAKNFVPGVQRFDGKGIDARAAVANVGSLLIHDRSGAAVTVAEMPRLAPFVPAATDPPETVVKKLKQLKGAIDQSGGLMVEAYPALGKRASSRSTAPTGDAGAADPVAEALKKYGG